MNKRYVVFLVVVAVAVTAYMLFLQDQSPTPPEHSNTDQSSNIPQNMSDPQREVSNVPTQKSSNPSGINNEKEFREKFKGDWQFLRHDEKIHSILGGEIPGYRNSPDGAMRFVQEVAGLFGVDPQQLDPNRISTVETGLRQAYHIGQSSDGVPVYQGSVAVFYSKNSGNIALLNSELQGFDTKLEGPKLSARQATNAIELSREWENVRVDNVQGVVLYVKNRVAIPSYVVTAVATEHSETWEVVIDGVTGEILHRHARNIDEDRKFH